MIVASASWRDSTFSQSVRDLLQLGLCAFCAQGPFVPEQERRKSSRKSNNEDKKSVKQNMSNTQWSNLL
jgi:hypothetical protein